MKTIAIIPARGGSKGIPLKNLRLLNGKPLISYAVNAAKKSVYIDRVIVSTDSAEISKVARSHGAEVVLRPPEISGDEASSESALLHVLDSLKEKEHYNPDVIVFIQCTAPLVQCFDIDGAVLLLMSEKADSVFAAARFNHFLWRYSTSKEPQGINHTSSLRLMRQQRSPEYIEAGSVYVMNEIAFRSQKTRFCGKSVIYEIPKSRCFEIDDEEDLTLAAALLS